ncbi:Nucleolar complex protein 4 [Cyanidiococcus yangmingshanensis]|uniref:Nucleolar complex protein 4 n=1 Tax=Cyanidiococcus yangmingshanensis TaxID=2690220 RepID=A0A7J7IL70_9RHOD|nr:Nucleolar complex protein 4 [Cyanidiococcus yangmingshanensis]
MGAIDPTSELHRLSLDLQSALKRPAARPTALERVASCAKQTLIRKQVWDRCRKDALDVLANWFGCLRATLQSTEKVRPTADASCRRSAAALAETLLLVAPWVLSAGQENDLALVCSIAGGLCALELVPWRKCWHEMVRILLVETQADIWPKWHAVLVLGCASAFLDLRLQTLLAVPLALGGPVGRADAPLAAQEAPVSPDAQTAWFLILKPIGRLLAQDPNQQQGTTMYRAMNSSKTECQLGKNRHRLAKAMRRAFTDALFAVWRALGTKVASPQSPLLDLFGELADALLPGGCIAEPIRLADPLLETFQQGMYPGDAYGLVALEPLFFLMQHEGLEYERIYENLYGTLESRALLNLSACGPPVKGRFLRTVSRLLSSSHVPVALINAYTKRLARVAIDSSDPTITLWSLRLSLELVCRHVGTRQLLEATAQPRCPRNETALGDHGAASAFRRVEEKFVPSPASGNRHVARTKRMACGFVFWEQQSASVGADVAKTSETERWLDPFLPTESDPRRANASLSYLWEIDVLARHYLPSVRQLAALFRNITEASTQAGPLDAWCDVAPQDLIDLELRRSKRLVTGKPRTLVPAADDARETVL